MGVYFCAEFDTWDNYKMSQGAENSKRKEGYGPKPPPVSVTIKQLLQRYPDGQIFKVT